MWLLFFFFCAPTACGSSLTRDNLRHSSDPSYYTDKARSLTHCTTGVLLIVALISTSLMTNDAKILHVLIIWIPSLVKCLFKSLDKWKKKKAGCLLWCKRSLIPLPGMFSKYFFLVCGLPFHYVCIFWRRSLQFSKPNLLTFSFIVCAFITYLWNLCLAQSIYTAL